MAISFSCTGCGTRYSVKDEFAGKKTRCKKCNATISIPEPDGLADLAALDAPALGSPPAPPVSAPAYQAPSAYQAPAYQPSAYQPTAYQPQPHRPASSGGGLGTIKIPEGLNVKIAMFLLLLLVGSAIYSFYNVGALLNKVYVPDPLHGRVWFFIVLAVVMMLVQHLLLTSLTAWGCVKAAASLAKTSTLEPSYILVAGAVACPSIALTLTTGTFIANAVSGTATRSSAIDGVVLLIGGGVFALLLSVVLLQALLHLDWKTTGISLGILIVVMPFTLFFGGRYVMPKASGIAQSTAGLTRESVEKWARDNPEEVRAWRAAREAEARSKYEEQRAAAEAVERQRREAEEARLRADPLYGKTEEATAALDDLAKRVESSFREDLEPVRDAALAAVAALKPAAPSDLWNALDKRAKDLTAQVARAPKKEIPAWVFEKPEIAESKVVPLPDEELSKPYDVFGWSIRVPKAFKIDLQGFDNRTRELRFVNDPNRGDAIIITSITDLNPDQKQLYVYPDTRFRALAEQQRLLAVGTNQAETSKLRIGDLVFFAVPTKVNNGWTDTTIYYVRDDKGWLKIVLQPDTFTRDTSKLPTVVSLLPTLSAAGEGAIDPYGPQEIAQRVDDDARRSVGILETYGEKALPQLKEIYATSTGGGKMFARDAIEKITGERPDPSPAVGTPAKPAAPATPVTITEALATVDAASNVFAKRDAIKALATATYDASMRDQVAQRLEQMMLADDGYNYGEELAAAMQVWNRPQTATALMPLITNERVHQWLRKPVIKAMAATKERKAVLPVLRWIIKEPDTVVTAAIGMGEVVEDETIKLLMEKDGNVRKNAARILMQVGTRKSMGGLLRAAKDPRDPNAAAVAQAAYDQVKDRVNAATTKPAE